MGLEVLAALGTDYAVSRLNEIAPRVQFKTLEEQARRKIAQIDVPTPRTTRSSPRPRGRSFAALEKEARPVVADQIRRFESALADQPSWTAAAFTGLLLGHPLLRHLVGRLLWVAGTRPRRGSGPRPAQLAGSTLIGSPSRKAAMSATTSA